MKINFLSPQIFLFIVLFFIDFSAQASFPNNEEESHDNEFCQYDKYKGRNPKYCPHIEVINYGVTVYFHDELQSKMRSFLDSTIEAKKNKSEHFPVKLSKRFLSKLIGYQNFVRDTAIYNADKKVMNIGYEVDLIPSGENVVAVTGMFISTSEFFRMTRDVSPSMSEKDVETYLKNLIETHVNNVVGEKILF